MVFQRKKTEKSTALSVRAIAAQVILQVLDQGKSLSTLLPEVQLQVKPQDLPLLQEITFGICCLLPRLENIIKKLLDKPLKGKTRIVHCLLLVGLYQLLYMRIPAHAAVDEVVQQLLPLAEQPCQRGEQGHEQIQEGRHRRGDGLRHLLGDALGAYFAEDQHHDGQHDGGDRCAPLLAQSLGKEHRCDGSCTDVDDIIADEDGGEQLVVLFRHGQHTGRRLVAVLGAAFQTDLIQGRKCGLRGGEKGGKCHQNHQRYEKRHTAIVHKKENHTQLSVIL